MIKHRINKDLCIDVTMLIINTLCIIPTISYLYDTCLCCGTLCDDITFELTYQAFIMVAYIAYIILFIYVYTKIMLIKREVNKT